MLPKLMNNYKVVVLLIIIFIIAIAGAFYIYRSQTAKQQITDFEPLPTGKMTFPSPSPSPSPVSATQVPSQQPAAGSDIIEIKNEGIKVLAPIASSQIASPINVSGFANVFGDKVQINIKDANGKILGSNSAIACMGYDACPFGATINFEKSTTEAGIIEVYNPSGVDGSPRYLQTILVRF